MTVVDWLILAARFLACVAFGASVVVAVRIVQRRSRRCARLLVAGLMARAAVGVSAFWISYAGLPVLTQLQLGPGFWDLAPDAETYYETALLALDHGFGVINWERGSPFHIMIVAVWMSIVGVSPAATMFLNFLAYAWTMALIVTWLAPDRTGDEAPALVTLLGFALSPALLLHGSQPLKDEIFIYLIVTVTLGSALVLRQLIRDTARVRRWSRAATVTAIMCGAVYLMSGIRTYYPPLLLAGLAVALGAGLRRVPRPVWRPYIAFSVASLAALSITYLVGAGPIFGLFLNYGVDRARQGFIASPGGTSLVDARVPPPRMHVPATLDTPETARRAARARRASGAGSTGSGGAAAAAPTSEVAADLDFTITPTRPPADTTGATARKPSSPAGATGATRKPSSPAAAVSDGIAADAAASEEPPEPPVPPRPPTVWDTWIRLLFPSEFLFRVRATANGLLAMFVPISLLQAAGVVQLAGGRGLLLVTDVDTLFMDLTIGLVAWVCWKRRRALQRNWPIALVLLVPTIGLMLLEAYVVTNYGAMFRMRLTMVATAWLLPLAVVDLPERRLAEP